MAPGRRAGACRVWLVGGSLLLLAALAPRVVPAQEAVSALPAPMTRSLYRAHWFEFLNAHLEDDARGAAAALAAMRKSARAVGVRRLSDFSRTAVHEGRKAESLGKPERAARAYDAAVLLDDTNYDAILSRIGFLTRRGAYSQASRMIPDAAGALLATRESRLTLGSSAAVWFSFAVAASLFGLILILLLKNSSRISHDLGEMSRRMGGGAAAPLALVIGLLPLAFGLGPGWVVLYWGALLITYTLGTERAVLAAVLIGLGLLVPALSAVFRENVVERSPLWVAAVDLEERREDASAEDGLRQASGVFAEDPDVWFLLGMYAERSGDSERAISSYDRAVQADPRDYRPFLNRGNVHFLDGDYLQAIRDYDAAAERAPKAAEIPYNLSLARGEAYDFEGQSAAMTRARALSAASVISWTERPTVGRVVSAGYPLSRARQRIEQWNRQPKSRRLPGHAPPLRAAGLLLTPFALGPWLSLLLGVAISYWRSKRAVAIECARCGTAVCDSCRRYGDHPLYCSECVRFHVRKENVGIAAHVAQAGEIRARVRSRDRLCRLLSVLLPGTHQVFADRAFAGLLTLAVFFFCVGVAAIGGRYFDPRQLPSSAGGGPALIVPLAVAFLVWAVSLSSAWRYSHGS